MSQHDLQTSARKDTPNGTAGEPSYGSAQREPDLTSVLGHLAGDSQNPHEGERNIVASAIWLALQACDPEELPSLARLVRRFSHEIESRAQLARGKDLSLRGNLELAPVLALCAEIHRVGFIDADGKQARSLLFMALVDLAIHCPALVTATSFRQAANGLRIQLERLKATPKSGSATHHFSVWQLFDWVAAHGDLAEYVKSAVRNLRARFLVAWRAFEVGEEDNPQGENEGDDDDAICVETTADQTFWMLPDSSRFEVELPVDLKRKLLAAELTRIAAMSRFASASLLIRSDEAMTATVAGLTEQVARKTSDALDALAKLLAIAGCLPLGKAYEVRWASAGTFPGTPPYPGVLTPDARWLIRSELDPRSTKVPFHARSLHIPIPEPLAKLLREHGTCLKAGDAVIQIGEECIPPTPREASAWETTVASRLMRDTRFGVSLAQHVMHSTYGLDVSPLYYDRIPASYVAHGVAKVTHPWFGASPRPHAAGVPTHHIGSQRVVDKERVRVFMKSLRTGWRKEQDLWERIHLRSRNLRYGFLLSVAHRTNERLAEITTRWIACDDLLTTIADKEIAINYPHRLAALGTKAVEELEQYLTELHEATRSYPDTPLAHAASRILAGEQCLFLAVHSPWDCHAITLDEHVAESPAWAKDIINWLRHFANDELAAKLPEPLRVAQMGWTGTRSGATSELSLMSVQDALYKVRNALDAILKESGWAPLAASGYGPVERATAPVHWARAGRDHERAFQLGLDKLKESTDDSRRLFVEKVLPSVNAFFRSNSIALEATSQGLRPLGNVQPIPLGRNDHAALLRAMGSGRDTHMLARELLHAWLSEARRAKLTAGPIPSKPVRVWPQHSSPFLFDAPHSIRHRNDVVKAAHAVSLSAAARTFITLMMEGWIPDADAILQFMQPGAALHELIEKDVLLVECTITSGSPPMMTGAVGFNGAAAIALRAWHRGGDARVPDRTALQKEIHSAIHAVLAENVPPEEVLVELEALMRAYWGLRVPGVIRDVVTCRVAPSFAPLRRVVALHEDLPIWPEESGRPALDGVKTGIVKARRHAVLAEYDKIKAILSCLAGSWNPAKDEQVRAEAITSLCLLIPNGTPRSGAHIVALYAAAYLAEGLRKEQVRPVTVQDAVYSIGSALIQALPEQGDFSRRELWQATYARLIQTCIPKDRFRIAKDLAHFQKVMARECDLPTVNLSPLLDALDVPAPPEPIGFLTRAEQEAVVSMARHRVHALADQGSPEEQQAALCALAIITAALSTSMRDREFRVPLLKDWKAKGNEAAHIALRSNGLDFLKSAAGRRSVGLSGAYGSVAEDAINRLSALKASTSISLHREKLFSPNAFAIGENDLVDVMRKLNADLRYVTATRLAAIDLSRKSWALKAFRELGAGQASNWPARDLLSEMGQAHIRTMQAHYVHDPLAFLEKVPRDRRPSRAAAGWILGMNPKAAHRLLGKASSWLKPAASGALAVPQESMSCRLDVGEARISFEPALADIDTLLRLLAEGQSVQSATDLLAWPRRTNPALEQALAELKTKGVAIDGTEDEGQFVIAPPSRAHSEPSLDACRRDAFSWAPMAWIFGAWLVDWRAREQRGVAVRSEEWNRVVGQDTPISRLPWQTHERGHVTCYRLGAKSKGSHSPWPMFRWLCLSAWVREWVIACPTTRTHFPH
ncbi:MAG: hypothetical protein FH747_09725 [Stenotrophomonas sp.]|uniref:hypothetical protein n=1 Tax=Stenotrophomonas sp. TaxID=69392 RepID=UPI0013538DB6|nr:hypothetical protein [Stenotrophomonas sp.]MTI73919.1 hypothetical protein [Stenotrophomonas sp.]